MDNVNEKAEKALNDLASIISSIAKNINNAAESISDAFKSPLENMIRDARDAGIKFEDIGAKIVDSLEESLRQEGKAITMPNLIKQLKNWNLDTEIIKSIQRLAEERDKYIIGTKNLASDMADELMKPFNMFVSAFEKIPGGKIFSKIFKFDEAKKNIHNNITSQLLKASQGAAIEFKTLKSVGSAAFAEIGNAGKAAMAHPVLLAVAAIILALKVAYDQWNKMIDSAKKLRDETGLTGKQAMQLSRINQTISTQYQSMGVDMEVMANSTSALVNEFQTLNALTNGMMRNAGIMVGALGVTPDIASKTLRLFKNMNVETDDMALSLTGAIANASKLGGVAPAAVFKDLAESSREIYLYFKGNIVNAAKAAIELRRMGTSLKEAANTAKSLLDFESSITAELEASVLAGTQLDFSRARYAAFTGDLVGQQNEILNQMERIHNFENMNVIQKEAIARATGMELDQLENMIAQRKAINDMSFDEKRRYEESLNAIRKFRTENKADLILENQRVFMQEKVAKIWDNIINILSSVLFPIFDAIYDIVDDIATEIQKWLITDEGTKTMRELKEAVEQVVTVAKALTPILIGIMKISLKMHTFTMTTFINPIVNGLKLITNVINGDFKTSFEDVFEFFKSIGKSILFPITYPLKLIAEIIDEIFGTHLSDILSLAIDLVANKFSEMVMGISNIIVNIFSYIWKTIAEPFKIAINIIRKIFSGDFKEVLLMLPELIKSNVNMIIGYMSMPFRWLSETIDEIFGTNITNIFDSFLSYVSGVFSVIYTTLISPFLLAFSVITTGFDNMREYITQWWNKIYDNVIKPISVAWNYITGSEPDNATVDVNNVPKTATGGITTKPQIRMVGEEGPEAIIPLNKMDNYTNDNTVLVSKMDELIGKIGNTDVIRKLDKLITVIESLDLNMDGKKVGELISRSSPSIGMG